MHLFEAKWGYFGGWYRINGGREMMGNAEM